MSVNAHVERREHESLESMLRRFNQQVSDSALLFEIKKRAFYMTPAEVKAYKQKQNERRYARTAYKKKKARKEAEED